MSREPNAILAINSLDRYIANRPPTLSFFLANWGDAALNIFIKESQPYGASRPMVGSVLTASGISPYYTDLSGAPIVTQFGYTTENGTSILAGGIYTVLSLGTTDWAFIGAGSATPAIGTVFQATNNGIGNGTVSWVSIAFISKPTTSLQTQFARVGQWTFPRTTNQGQSPISSALYSIYNTKPPYSNSFSIQSPGALIYGYIKHIIVSQIQLQYNIPTVNLELNDLLIINNGTTYVEINIPKGFYYPDELAAILQTIIAGETDLSAFMIEVKFDPRVGFVFESFSTPKRAFSFPDPSNLAYFYPETYDASLITNIYKTYKLLGLEKFNSLASPIQTSFEYPNFLYTPYIDIYSDILTNYQNVKDTNTSVSKPKGLVARVLLSGTGNIQPTSALDSLGSRSFVVTADLNSPKIIRWSPDVAVPTIDFELRDCYGDLIPGPNEKNKTIYSYQTEFQMTLLCSEGGD